MRFDDCKKHNGDNVRMVEYRVKKKELYIHKTNRIQHDWFSDIVEARWEHEPNRDRHEWSEGQRKWLIIFYVWIAAKPNNSQNGRRFEFVCLLMGGVALKHWHWTIINVPEVHHSKNTLAKMCRYILHLYVNVWVFIESTWVIEKWEMRWKWAQKQAGQTHQKSENLWVPKMFSGNSHGKCKRICTTVNIVMWSENIIGHSFVQTFTFIKSCINIFSFLIYIYNINVLFLNLAF